MARPWRASGPTGEERAPLPGDHTESRDRRLHRARARARVARTGRVRAVWPCRRQPPSGMVLLHGKGLDVDTRQLMVADVMTIDPVVVEVDASLEEATRLFHANSVTGLPVIDADGDLVGVISQTDVVAVMDSPIGRLIRTKPNGLRVGEVMSSPAITVPMTGSLDDAARLMLDNRVHRLVATDDAGRPVGVLSAIDYVALYAERDPGVQPES
jgi:CBS domain-containing protein